MSSLPYPTRVALGTWTVRQCANEEGWLSGFDWVVESDTGFNLTIDCFEMIDPVSGQVVLYAGDDPLTAGLSYSQARRIAKILNEREDEAPTNQQGESNDDNDEA